MRFPLAIAASVLMISPCYAQQIAPSRTYSSTAMMPKKIDPLPGDQFRQGMKGQPNKPMFGFQATPLRPVDVAPTRARLASHADTTLAEPLTLSQPGSGKMTDLYDVPPAETALPGQKRDPISADAGQ